MKRTHCNRNWFRMVHQEPKPARPKHIQTIASICHISWIKKNTEKPCVILALWVWFFSESFARLRTATCCQLTLRLHTLAEKECVMGSGRMQTGARTRVSVEYCAAFLYGWIQNTLLILFASDDRNCEITKFQSTDGVRSAELREERREGYRRLRREVHRHVMIFLTNKLK